MAPGPGWPGAEKPHWPHQLALASTADIDAYVVELVVSEPVVERWQTGSLEIAIGDGRGRRSAGALYSLDEDQGEIRVPRLARYEYVVLHEVSHVLADRAQGRRAVAAHGWEFCATLLDLVEIQLGEDARQQLEESFCRHRVQFRPKRPGRKLTPDQRVVAVENLRRARELQSV